MTPAPPVEWWDSLDPEIAVGCFVAQAVEEGAANIGDAATLDRVAAMCAALPGSSRARVVEEAMQDPAMRAAALALASRWCAERDADAARQVQEAGGPGLAVALVDGAIGSAITQASEIPWATLSRMMTEPIRWAGEKATAPAWLPIRLADGAPMTRKDAHVGAVSCMVFDLDDGAALDALLPRVEALGYAAALHTTWSHTPGHHKARVVFPLDGDCPRADWLEVWQAGEQWARTWGATIDPACKNPSRLYFLPALPAGEWEERRPWFVGRVFGGERLSWRWLRAHHMPAPVRAVPPVPKGPTWVGTSTRGLDREERRRRAFALGAVRHRCKGMVGGRRNVVTMATARFGAAMVAAGAMTEVEVFDMIMEAAMGAGLSQSEADRTIRNGLAAGKEDPPWDFSTR